MEFFGDLGALTAALIILASFFASALTAALGLGGGMMLLGVMSALLPPAAIIPVHGVAQLGSNISRLFFLRADVLWRTAGLIIAGGVIGAAFGGQLAINAPNWIFRPIIGLLIIYTTWANLPPLPKLGRASLLGAGIGASFMSMFLGATGPIVATLLRALDLPRQKLVGTHAACMSAQHGAKVFVFAALGFSFLPWIGLIIGILIAGSLGSALGTKLLNQTPEQSFRRAFKVTLSLIAVYLIISPFTGNFAA